MAIFYPDILEHNNPAKALVDITQLRGTSYPLGTLSQTGSIPTDKRNLGTMVFVSSSQEFYGFYGQTTGSSDWDNPSNWKVLSTPSGSFSGAFSGAFTGSFSGSVTAPGSNTQIVFNNAGTLSANSGLVYSGSRVGIGTTSPTQALDVSGSISLAGNVVQQLTNLDIKVSGTQEGRALRFIASSTGARIQAIGSTTSNLSLSTTVASSEVTRMTILEGGDVGIGTTSPSQKLTVAGGLFLTGSGAAAPLILSDGNYIYGGGSTTANNAIFGVISTQTELYARNNRIGIWGPGGSSNYLYAVGGDFGIGTGAVTPSARLHISGASSANLLRIESPASPNILVVSGSRLVAIGTATPQRLFDVYNGGSSGIAASFGAQFSNGGFSGISFGYVEQANALYRKSALVFERTETHGGGSNASGKIHFLLNNNSSTSATALTDAVVTIDSVGTAVGSVRMGIGTRFPTASLHISGTVASDNLMRVQSTTGAEYFFISGSGNIGIGTTVPSQKLEISGNQRITGGFLEFFGGTTYPQISRSGASGGLIINTSGPVASANALLSVRNNSGADFVTVIGGGNVGIGTTSPSFKLHVLGTSGGDSTFTSGILIDNNNATDGEPTLAFRVNSMVAGGNYWLTGLNQTNNYSIAYGTSFTDANTLFRVSADGNVGIGNTSPAYKLDVAGSVNTNTHYQSLGTVFGRDSRQNNFITYSDSTVASNRTLTIGNATYSNTIFPSGNVGIGTTSPSQKLTVAGDALITGSLTVQGTVTAKEFKTEFVSASITYISGSHKFGDSTDDVHQFTGSVFINGPLTATSFTGSFSGSVSGPVTAPGSDTQIVFNSGGLLSADSGLVYSGSNVGINTASPTEKLHINEGILKIKKTANTGEVAQFDVNGNQKIVSFLRTGVERAKMSFEDGTTLRIEAASGINLMGGNVGIGLTAPSARLHISGASSANLLRIDSSAFSSILYVSGSGRVGINTTNPQRELDVNGAVRLGTIIKTGGGNNLSFLSDSGGAVTLNIGGAIIGTLYDSTPNFNEIRTSNNQNLSVNVRGSGSLFLQTADTTRMTITGSNVGIGLTAPSATLHISGASSANLLRVSSPASSNILFVSGNGNIGLGLDNPSTALHIARIATTAPIIRLQTTDSTTNGNIQWTNSANSILVRIGSNMAVGDSGGNLEFQTGGTNPRMLITSTGNVGIGETSPTARLHVSGTIKISSSTAEKHLEFTRAGNNYITTPSGGSLLVNLVGTAIENTSILGINTAGVKIGTGFAAPSAQLHVRGTGITSATTALRVENANASASMVVNDDGVVGIGSGVLSGVVGKLEMAVDGVTNGIGFYDGTGTSFRIWRGSDVAILGRGVNTAIAIANTNNVGIGTTTPSQKLTVAGDALITGSLTVNGTVTAKEFKTEFVSASITYISGSHKFGDSADDVHQFTGSVFVNGPVTATSFTGSFSGSVSGPVTAPGSDTQIVFNSGGLLSADSGLVYSGSRVGIGTTTPTTGKLQVNTTAASNNAITIQASNQTSRTYGLGIDSSSNLAVYDNTSAATRMVISSAGNVGIGVASPSATLHISGASSANLLRIDSPASSSILFVSGSGNVGIGVTNPVQKLEVAGVISAYDRNNGSTNGQLWASTTAGATTVILHSSGSSYLNGGNVGIGTTNPGAKFHIEGTTVSYGQARLINTSTTGEASIHIGRSNQTTEQRWTIGQGTAGIVDSFGFYTGGSNRMVITPAGNVGIGETSPSARLEVRGSGATAATTALRVENSSQTTSLVVLDNGNVGIGTTAPSSSLQVNGNAYISASFSTSSAALTVYKSGSTVFDVQGSQGQLFSITDSLSGSLFSVNDISGLPILEVFSDNTILMGDYLAPSLNTTERLTVNSGVTTLYAIPTASYDGAFFEYTIRSGSNARAGQIMGMWSGTSVNHTETTTTDFGNTSGFTFGMSISGSNMILSSSAATSGWTFKTIIRSI